MASRALHTVPGDGGGWAVVHKGSTRSLGNFSTKLEVQAAGRERAKRAKAEHIIHLRDGRIGSRNSDGSDPRRRKG